MQAIPRIAVITEGAASSQAITGALSPLHTEDSIHCFHSLEKAHKHIAQAQQTFSVCILETDLDDSDGLDFYRSTLRPAGIRTLLISGPVARPRILEALESGIDELIERDSRGRYLDFLSHSLTRILGHVRESQARSEAEATLKSVANDLGGLYGKEFFRQLTIKLSECLHVDYALVAEVRGATRKKIRTLAVADKAVVQPNYDYTAANRPSEDVVAGRPCIIPDGLIKRFPHDTYLREMKLISYAGVPLLDSRKNVCGLLAVMDRKPFGNPEVTLSALRAFAARAEIEMERVRVQDSLELQARIFDQIGQAVICAEPDGLIKGWNLQARELAGYTRSEILGQPIDLVFPGKDAHYLASTVIEPLILKGQLNIETELRHKSGQIIEVAIVFTLEKNSQDEVTGVIACCHDITERRRALRREREAQQRLAFHVQRTPLGCIEWDRTSKILSCNQAAAAIFEYEPHELVGQSYNTIVQEKDLPTIDGIFRKLKDKEGGERSTNENITRSGRVITCEWYNTPLVNEQGEVIGFASLVDDITTRIRNEHMLKESQKEAARANRSKDEFLAVMSHEIRTPMNSIIGFADLLLETGVNPSQSENLEIIKANAYQLLDLINNVLNYSRLDSGKITLHHRDMDLNAMLFEVQEAMSAEASQKNLPLEVHCDPTLPRHIRTGYLEIRQVLLSLVNNAIKFTNQGKVSIHVTGHPTDDKHWHIRFTVTDTGIGIPPEHLDNIFEIFSQVDSSSTRRFGGTGLGLTISRRICNLLGGEITAESTPGQGSSFHVEIPVETVNHQQNLSTNPVQLQLEPTNLADYAETYPAEILIADDEAETCRLLGDILREMGYRHQIAHSGLECIEKLQNRTFDLIFMDVSMPEIDGIEATQLIREGQAGENHRNIYICAITAYNEGDDRQRCLDAGMNEHIGKPILTKTLTRILKKASLQRTH